MKRLLSPLGNLAILAGVSVIFVSTSTAASDEASYDPSNLPSRLTSVEMVPFAPGQEAAQRTKYLNNSKSLYLNQSCQSAAFPYLRSAAYWKQMDSELEVINHPSNGMRKLTRSSARQTCSNEATRQSYRSQLPRYPQRNFDRLCEMANSPNTYEGVNLGMVEPTLCLDLAYIENREYEACRRSAPRDLGDDFTEATAHQYCQCSSRRVANEFASGDIRVSSKSLVSTASAARNVCKSALKSGTISSATPATVKQQSATASATTSSTSSSSSSSTQDPFAELKGELNKLKEGLGGLFGD